MRKIYISFIPLLKKFYKLDTENQTLDSKMDNDTLEFDRKYLIYTILVFIMIITIILLVLYKFVPDLIPDSKMVIYFVGITLLIYFLHYYLKI